MLNTITLMGRLTGDPEVKRTNNDIAYCNFTIAVERDYSQGGEKQADFINVVVWRGTAEFLEKYFSKGSMIAVQGSLQSRKWQDKDGNNRISWDVQANHIWFCGGKNNKSSDKIMDDIPDVPQSDDDDDLPF